MYLIITIIIMIIIIVTIKKLWMMKCKTIDNDTILKISSFLNEILYSQKNVLILVRLQLPDPKSNHANVKISSLRKAEYLLQFNRKWIVDSTWQVSSQGCEKIDVRLVNYFSS